MTAWLKTPWPELAARCWFCGTPRGHLCVTAGGRIAGGPYAYRSHAYRGIQRFQPGGRHGALATLLPARRNPVGTSPRSSKARSAAGVTDKAPRRLLTKTSRSAGVFEGAVERGNVVTN
jgi:hypothetical protein